VNTSWLCSCLLAVTIQAATPFPLQLAEASGEWTARSMEYSLGAGVNLRLVVSPLQGQDRFYVFSSSHTTTPAAARVELKERLIASFHAYRIVDLTEAVTSHFGYEGTELRFSLVDDVQGKDCVLFVFAESEESWGVLYSKVSEAKTPIGRSPFAVLTRRPIPKAGVVELEPYRVSSAPFTAFPISLQITRHPISNQVMKVVVTEVPAGSTTEQVGVKVGDEIMAIDGRAARDFRGGVTKGSELGKIFLNRRYGDRVNLDLISAETKTAFTVTLQIPSLLDAMSRTPR
jgi:hypothetical protein